MSAEPSIQEVLRGEDSDIELTPEKLLQIVKAQRQCLQWFADIRTDPGVVIDQGEVARLVEKTRVHLSKTKLRKPQLVAEDPVERTVFLLLNFMQPQEEWTVMLQRDGKRKWVAYVEELPNKPPNDGQGNSALNAIRDLYQRMKGTELRRRADIMQEKAARKALLDDSRSR